jgi:hypothetical protein
MLSTIRGICPQVFHEINLERRMKWWIIGKTKETYMALLRMNLVAYGK